MSDRREFLAGIVATGAVARFGPRMDPPNFQSCLITGEFSSNVQGSPIYWNRQIVNPPGQYGFSNGIVQIVDAGLYVISGWARVYQDCGLESVLTLTGGPNTLQTRAGAGQRVVHFLADYQKLNNDSDDIAINFTSINDAGAYVKGAYLRIEMVP